MIEQLCLKHPRRNAETPALMEGWQKLKEWRRDIIANPPVHVYPESKQEDEKKEEPAELNDGDNKAKAPVKLYVADELQFVAQH